MRASKEINPEINLSTVKDNRKENHHYVPVFLLKNWCSGKDKKMWRYKRIPSGEIHAKRVSPKSTSFETDLNTLKQATLSGVNDKNFAVVENTLKKLDTQASVILTKMLNMGIPSLTEDERKIWLNFVFLLSDRHPDNLSEMELAGITIMDEVIDDAIRRCGREEVWRHAADLLRKSKFTYNYSRIRLHDFAKDTTCVERSGPLEWMIVDLSQSSLELFSSSLSVIADFRKRFLFEAGFLEMALTPKQLWLCAPNGFEFDNELIRILVLTYNVRLLLPHPRYIYSHHKIVDEQYVKYERVLKDFLG